MSISVGIITENPFHGDLGFSIRTRELSIGLANARCQVHVFSPVDQESEPYPNVFLHNISGKSNRNYDNIREFLRKWSKSKRYGRYFYLNSALSFISNQSAKMVYKSAKKYDLDLLQGTQATTSSVAIRVGKHLGIPVIGGMGGMLVEEAVQAEIFEQNSIFYNSCKRFVSSVIQNSAALICASEPMKKYLIDSYGVEGKKITVIPNGANIPEGERVKKSDGDYVILYAGILDIWEKVDVLIKSMPFVISRFPNAKLLIVGDGRLKNELTELVKNNNLDKSVSFLGLQPRKKTLEMMLEADVAVLPSSVDLVRKVACPIKLFDYMAAGLPIVTMDVGWWSDLVKSKNAGIVTADDPESFAEGICKAITEGHTTNNLLGYNARKVIAEEYNWKRISENLLQLYKSILDDN